MKVAQIPQGKKPNRNYPLNPYSNERRDLDYSHLLSPIHRRNGYSMWSYRVFDPHDPLWSDEHAPQFIRIIHNNRHVGEVMIEQNRPSPLFPGRKAYATFHSSLNKSHRGKGLGFRAYEAAISHARNQLDFKQVRGTHHSEDAHRVHMKLAAKYGLDYQGGERYSDKYIQNTHFGVLQNYPHKPYKYHIKAEQELLLEELSKAE